MVKRVLVPIADGCEEIEAVCVIDVLRRAGADVEVASVEPRRQITASRGVGLVADSLIADCVDKDYDLIVLPGGMPGAERLRDSQPLLDLLQRQRQSERWYAAICAAPAVVLQHHGLLHQTQATAHPAFFERLELPSDPASRVVVDGHCITSRGPGTAIEFALELVARLYGKEHAERIAEPLLMR